MYVTHDEDGNMFKVSTLTRQRRCTSATWLAIFIGTFHSARVNLDPAMGVGVRVYIFNIHSEQQKQQRSACQYPSVQNWKCSIHGAINKLAICKTAWSSRFSTGLTIRWSGTRCWWPICRAADFGNNEDLIVGAGCCSVIYLESIHEVGIIEWLVICCCEWMVGWRSWGVTFGLS